MSAVEAAVEIAAPPAAVWAVLSDLDRLGEWLTVHEDFAVAPDELHEGAELEQEVASGPVTATVQWRLGSVVAERELVWEGVATGGAEVRATYRLAATDAGTRVACTADFTIPGGPLGAVARRIAQPRGEAEAATSLERLRALVEAG